MIITWQSCNTKYSINKKSIGKNGKKVRCSNCGYEWYQKPDITKKSLPTKSLKEKQVTTKHVNEEIDAAKLFSSEVKIKKNYNKYLLFISSGTPKKELIEICKQRGIAPYFKNIYGSPEEKTKHVNNIITQNAYSKDEVIFIGDAILDFHQSMTASDYIDRQHYCREIWENFLSRKGFYFKFKNQIAKMVPKIMVEK